MADFNKEAKKGTVQPVYLLEVEANGSDGISYSTEQDWNGSTTLLNVDTVSEPGSVIGQVVNSGAEFGLSTIAEIVGVQFQYTAPAYADHINSIGFSFFSTNYLGPPAEPSGVKNVRFVIRSGSQTGPIIGDVTKPLQIDNVFLGNVGSLQKYRLQFSGYEIVKFLTPQSGGTYYVHIQISTAAIAGHQQLIELAVSTDRFFTAIDPEQVKIVTSILEFPEKPGSNVTFSVFDLRNAGTTIDYSVLAGDSIPLSVDIGTVVDGDAMPPYKAYEITAKLGSTLGETAQISEIILQTESFIYISDELDFPVVGSVPHLVTPLSGSIASELKFFDKSTIGEQSFNLYWKEIISEFIASGEFANKKLTAKLGFPGQSAAEFIDFFGGILYDSNQNQNTEQVTLKCRHILNEYEAGKLPVETSNPDGTRTTSPIIIEDRNIIDCMLLVIELQGTPDRFIDIATAEAIRDAYYTDPMWLLTRTISEPEESSDLLNQLEILSGTYIVQLPTGVISFVRLNLDSPATLTLDCNDFTVGELQGQEKARKTIQVIHFDPAVSNPGKKRDDYSKTYIDVDSVQIKKSGNTSSKIHFEKWTTNLDLIIQTADRMNILFANPLYKVKISKLPIDYNTKIVQGMTIALDNLQIPSTAQDYPGLTQGARHIVIGKETSNNNGQVAITVRPIFSDIVHFADLMTVDVGNVISGSIDDIHVEDNNRIEFAEVNTGVGLVAEFRFPGITTRPTTVEIVGYYTGNHTVNLECYDPIAKMWGTFYTFPQLGASDEHFTAPVNTAHLDLETDTFLFRLNHPANGNVNHRLFINKLVLNSRGV